jgi:hypothetical protein
VAHDPACLLNPGCLFNIPVTVRTEEGPGVVLSTPHPDLLLGLNAEVGRRLDDCPRWFEFAEK